jgi:hypothetical protein
MQSQKPSEPAPTPNRAARRGKKSTTAAAAGLRGSAAVPRPAQGRRINPIRRTG